MGAESLDGGAEELVVLPELLDRGSALAKIRRDIGDFDFISHRAPSRMTQPYWAADASAVANMAFSLEL